MMRFIFMRFSFDSDFCTILDKTACTLTAKTAVYFNFQYCIGFFNMLYLDIGIRKRDYDANTYCDRR